MHLQNGKQVQVHAALERPCPLYPNCLENALCFVIATSAELSLGGMGKALQHEGNKVEDNDINQNIPYVKISF